MSEDGKYAVGTVWWAPHPIFMFCHASIVDGDTQIDKATKQIKVPLIPIINSKSPLQTESVRGYTDDDNASAATQIFYAIRDNLLAYRPFQADKLTNVGQLDDLNESTVLNVLKERFYHKKIYTYSGSALISINPFETLPLYDRDTIAKYENCVMDDPHLPPHLFAVADQAYRGMLNQKKNQSIIVGGESGSGKTEAIKLVLRYLTRVTARSRERRASLTGGMKDGKALVKQPSMDKIHLTSTNLNLGLMESKLMECNPLIEAFGNAKTVRNNNSSRFGKYIRVSFKGNEIIGAQIEHYLLERSRLIHRAGEERSFHIFYQLCTGASASLRKNLELGNGAECANDFVYLGHSAITVDGVNDADEFKHTIQAMSLLNMNQETQDTVFQLLGGVLHLGNIVYETQGDKTVVSPKSQKSLAAVCRLLHMDLQAMTRAMVTREIKGVGVDKGKVYSVQLDLAQARESRDALAKVLFSRLFDWLIFKTNVSLKDASNGSHAGSTSFIGLLDIFGFEHFEVNSFEQFCINYANERVQQFYLTRMFKDEQKLYEEEKINWNLIKIDIDNSDRLQLIEGKPTGFLSILNEECIFPKGTDQSFVDKLENAHKGNKLFRAITTGANKGNFVIVHYAGEVTYTHHGFLQKNKDSLSPDLVGVIESSSNPLMKQMLSSTDNLPPTTSTHKKNISGSLRPGQLGGDNQKSTNFIAATFRDQLADLISVIGTTNTWFVRCIKPCFRQVPSTFINKMVFFQLQNAGVLDCVRIRRAGYPFRVLFLDFLNTYRPLCIDGKQKGIKFPTTAAEQKKLVQVSLNKHKVDEKLYQLGVTKVFLKDDAKEVLDSKIRAFYHDSVVKIQMCVRRYLVARRVRRRRIKNMMTKTRTVALIQAQWRGKITRRKVAKLKIQKAKEKAEAERQQKLAWEAAKRAEEERIKAENARIKREAEEFERRKKEQEAAEAKRKAEAEAKLKREQEENERRLKAEALRLQQEKEEWERRRLEDEQRVQNMKQEELDRLRKEQEQFQAKQKAELERINQQREEMERQRRMILEEAEQQRLIDAANRKREQEEFQRQQLAEMERVKRAKEHLVEMTREAHEAAEAKLKAEASELEALKQAMIERERKFKQEMELLRQKELDKLQEELMQKEQQTREEEARVRQELAEYKQTKRKLEEQFQREREEWLRQKQREEEEFELRRVEELELRREAEKLERRRREEDAILKREKEQWEKKRKEEEVEHESRLRESLERIKKEQEEWDTKRKAEREKLKAKRAAWEQQKREEERAAEDKRQAELRRLVEEAEEIESIKRAEREEIQKQREELARIRKEKGLLESEVRRAGEEDEEELARKEAKINEEISEWETKRREEQRRMELEKKEFEKRKEEMEADFSRKRAEEEAKFLEDKENHEKKQAADAKMIEKQLADAAARAKAVAETPIGKTLSRGAASPSPGSISAETAEGNYAAALAAIRDYGTSRSSELNGVVVLDHDEGNLNTGEVSRIGTPGATSVHRLNEDSTSHVDDFDNLSFDARSNSISLPRGSTLTLADQQSLRLAQTIRETLKGPLSSEQRETVITSALAAGLEPSILLAEGDDAVTGTADTIKRTMSKRVIEESEKEGIPEGMKSPKLTGEVEPVKSPVPRAISEYRPVTKSSRLKCGGISRVCGSSSSPLGGNEKTCSIM